MKYVLIILMLSIGLSSMAQEINIDIDKVKVEAEAKMEARRIESAKMDAQRDARRATARLKANEAILEGYFTIAVRGDGRIIYNIDGDEKIKLNCTQTENSLNVNNEKFFISSIDKCEEIKDAIRWVSENGNSVLLLFGGSSVGESGQRLYTREGEAYRKKEYKPGPITKLFPKLTPRVTKYELKDGSLTRYEGEIVFDGKVLSLFKKK
jgi:hypothetical protein